MSSATWADMTRTAAAISDSGRLVTQIHYRGTDGPDCWQYGDATVHLFKGAEVDMVVTSDGETYAPTLSGAEQ